MLLEVEDETRDFITVYKKDFPTKKTDRRKEYRPPLNYLPPLNILNGPYKRCLNTQRQNAILPLSEQSEDPQETLNRIRDEHSRLRRFLPEVVPDEDLIERKENEVKQTIYQLDYSKGDYSPRVKIYGREKDIQLPEYWIISETIQKKSYKNPWQIATEDLLRVKRAIKPPDNLTPNIKEREILRIRTGDSEYDATIDAVGNRVIKRRLFGPPLPIEPKIYSKGPDSPPSECSKILAEKKLVLPSSIF
ncbi:PREDICTED: uncharacterized protein LOC108578117 [Habropoda laboriosa]|uniref:uncharacterized protein LOC108578117 n=1 Tax=Habropoda laboriosa TaxID=597456 RepID=UPI00083D63CC|nr:PREDICTED: uncharacterized protein LOC108578117 [Habropoda laboriosa]